MKQESNILRGRMWLMLLVLFVWLVPQRAAADDAYETFVDQSILYNVFVSGSNTVTITVPCYDMEGADAWIYDGNLDASWEGQPHINLFHWAAKGDINNSQSTCPVTFFSNAPGYFNLTLGNTKNVTRLNPNTSVTYNVVRNDDKCTFGVTAVWVVPKEMRGKKIKLSWKVHRDGNSRDSVWLNEKGGLHDPEPITIPEASPVAPPFVTAANISNDSVGKIMVPWTMIPEKISKLRYEYLDANNRTVTKEVKTTSNSGIITLNATEPHRKFRLIADYYEPQSVGEFLITGATSEEQDLTMIHAPNNMTVRPSFGAKPKVEVKWNIDHTSDADMAEIDFFEVQRSLTGKEEDFVSVGQVPFARIGSVAQSEYTFVDSTFVNDVTASMLTDGSMLSNLTYRVRRTITQGWGWGSDNNCSATNKCILDNLHLQHIDSYGAKWEDESVYSVRVSWEYGNETGGLWDDRAKMILHIVSKNLNGEIVEDKAIELTQAEREQRYKIVNLSRPCVNYDIEVYVDRNESPFNYYEQRTTAYFPIRTEADWETFVKKVEEARGQYDVNARLYADISVISTYDKKNMVGSTIGAPYRGFFDGNGHTLTFDHPGIEDEEIAPFRYVGNATISALHTAGTIRTNYRYVGGLIAQVVTDCSAVIESCRSSVTINSGVDGIAYNGGFVSVVNSNANVTFRTCKFDGSFEGSNSSHNGGFVGRNNGRVTINSSLFAPEHINTKLDGCQTWVGTFTGETVTVNNSYATQFYSQHYDLQNRFIIRNAEDWDAFVAEVKAADGNKDVDAIMYSDISVSKMVGDDLNYPYRGTFNGNGHTLDVNIDGDGGRYGAPFRYVSQAHFRDLHVTGTVRNSTRYAAGLIGNCLNTTYIDRVWVSAAIEADGKYMGGFVGLSDHPDTRLNDCRFDGSLKNESTSYAGVFLVHDEEGMANGYRLYENGTYTGINETGIFYNYYRDLSYTGISCVSAHNWNTVHQDLQNITDQNQVVEIMNKNQAGSWEIRDGKALPVMQTEQEGCPTESDLYDKLVSGWTREGDKLVPATITLSDDDLSGAFYIKSAEDWDKFCTYVKEAEGNADVNACLQADITITKSAGAEAASPFRGSFDGNGHTLTVNISGDGEYVAPFRYAKNYVIKNLHVAGTVKGGNYTAGLVAHSTATSVRRNIIMNCHVSAAVETTNDRAGGFIGNGFEHGHVIENCLFDGSITAVRPDVTSRAGVFMGWSTGTPNDVVSNCLENGSYNMSYTDISMNHTEGKEPWGNSGESTNNWSYHNWNQAFYVDTLSVAQLVEKLGKTNWQVVNEKVVPKQNHAPITDITFPFYHSGTGKIDEQLLAETRQSSVVLTWNTDGNPVDYFIVYRREAGQGDNDWVEIATNLDQMTYEDKTVSPLKNYQYKVRAMTDCEGNHHSETLAADGACKHTGRLEGYVRFNDGTGIADVELTISSGSVNVSVHTDESGHYVADELPYQGQPSITYDVYVGSMVEADVQSYSVTFNGETNDVMVSEFTAVNGRRFSGYVFYEGTNIPVKGVNFLVNGYKLYNASGKLVETDEEGNFSFRVKNSRNTIQVVKNGHTFLNDGQYTNNFTTDVANIRFHDATKVKLVGRVVGGKDQGDLPLGNNLSKNNLGDNLQMVLALEGDTKSWLVQDVQHPERTQRDTVYQHAGGGNHQTKVTTLRKRIEVTPDPATGEYMLMLPPVRWKVQQVYCTGYPTLYQNGQANEVIDLTDCLTVKDTTYVGSYRDVDNRTIHEPKASYNAIYNRIYRSPVELTYKQLSYDTFNYFGDKFYNATNLKGDRVKVPLAYKNPEDTTTAKYTFGHPVFSLERKYYIQVQVAERYVYNNDYTAERIDFVPVGGGKATMHNGLKNGVAVDTLSLDSLGQGTFALQADRVAQPIGMENALRTVTFSAMQDNVHFEAEPLHAYVLNLFPLSGGKELMTDGQPVLFDILRDPPGAYSSSTLAKGATLNNSYSMNLTMAGGLNFSFSVADKMDWFEGDAVGDIYELSGNFDGDFDGIEHGSEKVDVSYSDLVFNYNGSKAWSHTMVLSDAVSTSGDPSMVGADADLYIGQVQNVQVTPLSSISVLTDSVYQSRLAQAGIGQANTKGDVAQYAKYGTLVHIADGVDADGKKFHLVRDVSLGYGPKLKSNFIYSQKQILEQIIPNLAGEIMNHMFIGSKTDAQILANSTHKPVYRSLREPTDPKFALPNKKYNTTVETPNDSTHYIIVLPTGKKVGDFNDEVSDKGEIIYAWSKMITQNEREKLNASELVNSYDIAGAQGVNYSETFSSSYSNATSMYFPYGVQPDYFGGKGTGTISSIASTITNYIGGAIFGYIESFKKLDPKVSGGVKNQESSIKFDGKYFRWSLTPVLTSQTIGTNSLSNEYNRTASFTIAAAPTSRLSVDVYRVPMADITTEGGKWLPEDVYSNYNFQNVTKETLDYLRRESNVPQHSDPSSFVFRTRGGVTSNPWEDGRKTRFYQAGSILDERTLKVDNPTISLDKQSVSGVSVNDPARFTIFIANESEKPEATGGLSVFTLFSVDQANPNGAKLSVNGQTLTSGGMSVTLVPGMTTQLELEVRAGQGFDYEGLTIGLMSPTDPEHAKATAKFDVHFLREAGAVTISAPVDKWVLNTNAQKDDERGWYIPVTIGGFDRHQLNFDHIEFQYKESQRGDDTWTNICSYYADSTLMAKANGVCELMKPNANIVTEFYGDGWEMERSYDLRAVLFCRNGGTFLTTPSKVVSGIKDTRRPQLFGTPEPKSGLLLLNDDIVFNFSEDIDYNNLSASSHFEVRGEVNNNDISENVSLQFSGKASVETEAKRNFTGKDLTIEMRVNPAATNRDMPLFSHGTNGQKLQLWLTKDQKLRAVVNEETFESQSPIQEGSFRQVAVSISQKDSTLWLYSNGETIGKGYKLKTLYNGTGPLIFGRTNETDRTAIQYYEGRMMEARLWYRTMNAGLVGSYGLHRLTGYEKDLVDYYPMNEGSGDYAVDHTQGANAKLIGTSWAMPHGMSLHLNKEDKGLQLTDKAINRSAEQDYTLMFWFKTDAEGRGTLLSNGKGLKEISDDRNRFNIGFEADSLTFRSNGFATKLAGNWSDNQWHHYAMTVNRAHNVANIYMDTELSTTFAADSLGGISGGKPCIGATVDGNTPLKGNVDELIVFGQALPQTLIKTYSTKGPNGDEAGLLTYLSFDHQERNANNEIVMAPYAYSRRLHLDEKGQVRYQEDPVTGKPTGTPVRDYLFKDSPEKVMTRIDAEVAAPVVPNENVTNLNFSFIGKGNQIMVELDEPAAKLHHCNIYVTVRDVEDRNGNMMASPKTASYLVTNSSLEWLVNRMDTTIKYGNGQAIDLPFYNWSAKNHTYKIENCPRWLTLNKYTDAMAPQNADYVTATISNDLNVGTYNEIIYLTDEEGIAEPFYLNLTVEGEQPEWSKKVDSDLLRYSMNVIGQVYLYDQIDSDSRDIVGVFDKENVCHGFANITHDEQSGDNALYLTVYDNQVSGRELNFRLWQYSTGRELVLTPKQNITFENSAIVGSGTPVRFDGGESFVQNFSLKKGWNWVSFNMNSPQLADVNPLLNNIPWKEGDVLTDMGSDTLLVYKNKQWLTSGSTQNMTISPKKSYAIKVQEDCLFPIGGTVIKEESARTIEVKKGWNAIGYTPMTNLSVETALSDYYDNAQEGDVIKSHTEFAYFSKSGNVGRWRGSLQYMKPGEGYMLLRKGNDDVSFTYPYYEMGTSSSESGAKAARLTSSNEARSAVRARNTMTLSATVENFETEEGDLLVAYADGEVVGCEELSAEQTADGKPLFYMNVAGEAKQPIRFTIVRDGETVACTRNIMTFQTDAVIGSPEEPAVINFSDTQTYEEGKWYTIDGLLLQDKPTQKGVYIFGGKKVVIK